MQVHRMSLWEAIATLAPHGAFERTRVEAALGTTLSTTADGANDYFDLYRSTPVPLAAGVIVANVDLRIAREGSHPGFMVLDIAGTCVTLAQVRSHYGQLRISAVPRGRSVHDTTSHTSDRPWGTLSFSFAGRHPDCLASIAFDPVKPRLP